MNKEPTKRERVNNLMKMNSKLTFSQACILLGYDPKDPSLAENDVLDMFDQIFKGFKDDRNKI